MERDINERKGNPRDLIVGAALFALATLGCKATFEPSRQASVIASQQKASMLDSITELEGCVSEVDRVDFYRIIANRYNDENFPFNGNTAAMSEYIWLLQSNASEACN